jgi:hypothetical protein
VVFFVATVTSLAGCLALQVKNVCIWLTYKKDGKKDLTPQLHKQDNPFWYTFCPQTDIKKFLLHLCNSYMITKDSVSAFSLLAYWEFLSGTLWVYLKADMCGFNLSKRANNDRREKVREGEREQLALAT